MQSMGTLPIWLAIISVSALAAISRRPRVMLGVSSDTAQTITRIAVTSIVLIAGLYVILNHNYSAEDKKWGYGIVGTVVGFWLRA